MTRSVTATGWGRRALAIVGLLADFGACREQASSRSVDLTAETRWLQTTTAPPGSTVIEVSEVKEDSDGLSQAWRIATEQEWPAYAESVRSLISAAYACADRHPEELRCTRLTPGDRLELRLVRVESASGFGVTAQFGARPF